jgi:hypothetical protein
MRQTRALALIAVAVVFACDNVALPGTTGNASGSTATNATPEVTKEADEKAWSFSASASTYIVPQDQEYVQPTFTADRGWLHLEARYNYENLETGSVWVGYNFSVGEKLTLEATPMLGGVFGNTTGIAPGYEVSLTYRKFAFSTEGEWVLDTGDSAESFFYSWSELSVSPVEWFRIGLVGQRTRAYQTDVEIQRGLLAGFTYKKVDLTTYSFILNRGKPTWVFSVGMSF